MENTYKIATYYFPNYHSDKRNFATHGEGWNEWEVLKKALPRFEGHAQPKLPAWGYEDESEPKVMEKKIRAAADSGISSFIFDWYWYNDGPFLDKCLNEGFLQADNKNDIEFAIMWANHDWVDIHPAIRDSRRPVLYSGYITEETFIEATDYMIEHYFCEPNYMRIEGGLYFSIYELMRLIEGFGGIDNTKRILDDFRAKVKAAGLGELHINAVIWGVKILPTEKSIKDPNELVNKLGIDSVTSYVWIHHTEIAGFPYEDYDEYAQKAFKNYYENRDSFDAPYYPNVTMGWDSSPRTIQSDMYENLGYPYMGILKNNTPSNFKSALERVKKYMDESNLKEKFFTINAWNEWTEGSYLEPDTVNGMGYLDAIAQVFK